MTPRTKQKLDENTSLLLETVKRYKAGEITDEQMQYSIYCALEWMAADVARQMEQQTKQQDAANELALGMHQEPNTW